MTDCNVPDPMPEELMIVDSQGIPVSVVDVAKLQLEATRLMYQMAETAGDDDATDAVAAKWVKAHDPAYFGYLTSAALSLMTRHVLAPVLDVAAEMGVDLRAGLKQAAAETEATLGGDGV